MGSGSGRGNAAQLLPAHQLGNLFQLGIELIGALQHGEVTGVRQDDRIEIRNDRSVGIDISRIQVAVDAPHRNPQLTC